MMDRLTIRISSDSWLADLLVAGVDILHSWVFGVISIMLIPYINIMTWILDKVPDVFSPAMMSLVSWVNPYLPLVRHYLPLGWILSMVAVVVAVTLIGDIVRLIKKYVPLS